MLNEKDVEQIKLKGITTEKILFQMEILKQGTPYLKLNRHCSAGDGIKLISDDEFEQLTGIFEKYAKKRNLIRFIPASGMATRMFNKLLLFNNKNETIQKDSIALDASQGNEDTCQILNFIDNIRDFAFYDDLKMIMAQDGLDAEALIDADQYKEFINYLFTQKGLGYLDLPKGLLKFHKYSDENRTPLEEHLAEAAGYSKNENGICHLHFTVSPEHKIKFENLLKTVRKRYENKFNVRFEVSFSVQKESTDTISVDQKSQLFRLKDGTIFFRPGGHGALIENLNDIRGDIICIKNIDNVVPDRLKKSVIQWQKVLIGYLIMIQQKIFSYLDILISDSADKKLLKEILEFVNIRLYLKPEGLKSDKEYRDFLINILNRPIRVCGMVKNMGEPGGGPFWVESEDGTQSLQIVESVQVDPLSKKQQKILKSSTHFNSVDIICGVRNYQGIPFDLRKYVDASAVFVSEKTKDCSKIKIIELPGLWNGAMSNWNTIFIETPVSTFNPVKTINALLRNEHR